MSKCDHTFHRLGGIDDCPVCNPGGQATGPREGDCSCAYLHCEMVTQNRYDALSAELASYKKAKAENDERFQLRIGELEAERDRLQTIQQQDESEKYKWLSEKLALEKQLAESTAKVAEYINKAADWSRKCTMLELEVKTEQEQATQQLADMIEFKAERDSLRTELKSMTSQYQLKVSELQKQVAELNQELGRVSVIYQDQISKNTDLRRQAIEYIDASKELRAELKSAVSQYQLKVSELQGRLAECESQYLRRGERIKMLEQGWPAADITRLQEKLAAAEAWCERLADSIGKVHHKGDQTSSAAFDVKADYEKWKKDRS